VFALYQKASIEGISLSARPTFGIGRSQGGTSRRGIEEASFPLNV